MLNIDENALVSLLSVSIENVAIKAIRNIVNCFQHAAQTRLMYNWMTYGQRIIFHRYFQQPLYNCDGYYENEHRHTEGVAGIKCWL